ncbi:hypothetical protein MPTK1_4g03800 [Marchantia polymorpha subsp. ruderalis]|uniref:Uncharacterized protein n=2 Tax=Marchantia polymorpha TaxID=3197 RepID=A0AAF6B5Z8_MARPO|nr:hypothetical protein MARPO_0044s0094 [Marchantia polymorpha]BBN07432.1 hypothetical protein Mp_4g03800 [Marchantia polymorpha subsp. ruderalis]|eukprot:PTQ39669.1 hypothetical protein MARPO_0044s0094 [Marchantia polymorpha]
MRATFLEKLAGTIGCPHTRIQGFRVCSLQLCLFHFVRERSNVTFKAPEVVVIFSEMDHMECLWTAKAIHLHYALPGIAFWAEVARESVDSLSCGPSRSFVFSFRSLLPFFLLLDGLCLVSRVDLGLRLI